MGIFRQFPYSNFHEMNMDEILKNMRELNDEMDNFVIHWSEEIEENVTKWLEEHPEATTTVQDHSLTYIKMVNGTLGFVIPEMFGAIGDGFTDDTQAMQDAFDSGFNVYIPHNTYLINGTVTIRNDISVFGGGNRSVLKITGKITTDNIKHYIDFHDFTFFISKLSGNAIEIIAENNVLAQHSVNIHDMYFKMDNTTTNSTATMLYLYGVRESIISNSIFYGDNYNYSNNSTAIMANADANHLTMNINISGCHFYYIGNAIYADTTTANHIYLAGFRINDNTIIGCYYGIRFINFDTPTIINNMIDYCAIPIFTKGSTNITISDNYIQTAETGSCVHIQNGEHGANDCIVINNNIIHSSNSTEAGSDTTDGIFIEGFVSPNIMRHIKVTDNIIFRVKTAINISGSQFVEISGNQVFYAKLFIDGNSSTAYANVFDNYVQVDVPTFKSNDTATFRFSNNQWGARYTSGNLNGSISYSVDAHSSATYNVIFENAYFIGVPCVSVNFKDVGASWNDMFIAITSITNTGFTVKVVNASDTAHSNAITWTAVKA